MPVRVVLDNIGGHPCLRYEHTNPQLALSIGWATLNVGADTLVAHGDFFAWGEVAKEAKEHLQQQGRYLYYDYTEYAYHLMNLKNGIKDPGEKTYEEVALRYFAHTAEDSLLIDSLGVEAWLMIDSVTMDTAKWEFIKNNSRESYNHYLNKNLLAYTTHTIYDWWQTDSIVRKPDGKSELLVADDCASEAWGKDWRIPTEMHWRELYSNCVWEWVDETPADSLVDWNVTYKIGYKVMAKTPKIQLVQNGDTVIAPRDSVYIFLPVSGYCTGYGRRNQVVRNEFAEGHYWSRTLFSEDDALAFAMTFSMHDHQLMSLYRCMGLAIRPVTAKKSPAKEKKEE